MKKYAVLLWLLLPLPVLVTHFGHGQQWLALDHAGDLVRKAEAAEKSEDWKLADELYREASKLAGSSDPALRMRLDLAQTRTRFRNGDAVAAIDSSNRLLDDPAMASMPVEFRRDARELAGRIHYYAAWVMRLEGAGRELWMEEAELARQSYRLLTEESSQQGATDYSAEQQKNLESAVQLQRLSLTELMARPLPKEGQCMANQGLSEQMAKRRGQRGKQPGRGPNQEGPPNKGAGIQRFQPGAGS
jgi:hypothetical protein